MSYNRHYIDPDRKVNDEHAIRDIREYCSTKMWELILVETGRVKQLGTAAAFQELNTALAFCGIVGYPVHALGRTYCLDAYRAWMHDGDKPIMTDDEGFRLD